MNLHPVPCAFYLYPASGISSLQSSLYLRNKIFFGRGGVFLYDFIPNNQGEMNALDDLEIRDQEDGLIPDDRYYVNNRVMKHGVILSDSLRLAFFFHRIQKFQE